MDVRSIQKIIQEAEKKDSGYHDPAKDNCNVSVHQANDRNGFFIASTFRNDFPILPSTRLTVAMAVVLTWMHEAPEDKIISKFAELEIIFRMTSTYCFFFSLRLAVFTQFRGAARMLGYMLRTLEIGFVYFLGGLTSMQKNKALDMFKNDDGIRIMVSS
jgi:SNF2 family DNA or RNA helicase